MDLFLKVNLIFQSFLNILLCIGHLTKRGTFRGEIKKNLDRNEIIIFGNGPSLNKDIRDIDLNEGKKNIMVVNNFLNSEIFKKIKPNYYIIVDPGFFIKTDDKRILKIQNDFISNFSKHISWPINFIIPQKFSKSEIALSLRKNKFVKLIKFYDKPIVGGSNSISNLLFKLNFANPHFQNILIAAIFLSIKLNFKKILVYGADHSWHEDLYLDKNNILYRNDKHFNSKPTPVEIKIKNKSMSVSRQFNDLSRVFNTYNQIQSYASKSKVEIINKSTKTWIDAFKRK